MRPLYLHLRVAIGASGTLAILAGCSSAAQAPINSIASSSSNRHWGGPLTTVSTIVGIKNDWISTIYGSGSASCWNISPGLPSPAPFGHLSGPITLSYTPLCPTISTLPITYGPGGTSSAADCTFNVSYDGTNFVYGVTQGSSTACSAALSATTGYDEILTYAQKGPDARRSFRLQRAH
jgi:hypothetical protein